MRHLDLVRMRSSISSDFQEFCNEVEKGNSLCPSGVPRELLTVSECEEFLSSWIIRNFAFDEGLAASYVSQFPSVLSMKSGAGTMLDALRECVFTAVGDSLRPTISAIHHRQFNDYGWVQVAGAVEIGLASFDKYLVNDYFAPHRIRKEKVRELLDECSLSESVLSLKAMFWQVRAMISEFSNLPFDGQISRRRLSEANTFIEMAISRKSMPAEHQNKAAA